MKTNLLSTSLSVLATAVLCAAPVAATAQEAAAGAEATAPTQLDDPFAFPENFTIYGDNNPNVRTATAIVNDYPITGSDVEQRLALLVASSQAEIPDEEMKRLRIQVLRNLIDETLQIQAAESKEIVISDAEIEQAYARVAAQNFGQDTKKMDEYLASVGSSPASLKRQIKGELAWQQLLRREIAPFVNVSDEEVNDLIKRLEESRGTEEYRLGEIFLSATPENREAVAQNARRIVEQLKQGGSFQGYARQFSEASTAAVGGDLGFVRAAQLPSALAAAASNMEAGQLVGPVEIPGGFSILYMIDKRQVLMADPRDAVLSLKQISISFPPGSTQESAGERVRQFGEGVQSLTGCRDAEERAASFGAKVVTNDQIRARSLPEQLQGLVLDMQIGQTTPPFGSVEDGVSVLMLCGRDDPKVASGPSFDQLMNQLEEDRINKRAQRYLRDLRYDAYIKYN